MRAAAKMMRLKPVTKIPPDARIIKLRNYEDNLKAMQDIVKYNEKRGELALWEQKTDGIINRNEMVKRYESIMDKHESALEQRRARLKEKLEQEHFLLQKELDDKVIKPEEFRKQRAEKARNLAARREEERKALADDLIMKQWREGCDPLRHLESKQVLMNVVQVQKQQVQDKVARLQVEKESEKIWDIMSEQTKLKEEMQDQKAYEFRKNLDQEAKMILDSQVRERELQLKRIEDARQAEIAQLKAMWAAEEEQQREQDKIQHMKNQKLGEELRAFNTLKQNEAAKLLELEQEEDRRIVEEAIAKSKEQEDLEKELVEKQRDDARKYREHLKIQMQKEHEDETVRDTLIEEAEKEQWAKIEAVRQAQEDARVQLMNEVIASRDHQIAKKKNDKLHSEMERENDRQRIQEELAVLRKIEQDRLLKVKADRKQHQLDILAQVQSKQERRLQERKFEKLEHEMAKASERKYKAIIDNLLSEVQPETNFGRKTTKWYT